MQADPLPFLRARRPRRTAADRVQAALLGLAGGQAGITSHGETAWASITFAGARHRIELLFEGAEAVAAGETFIAELPEHEFAIPRQLVADAAITEVDNRLDPPRLAVAIELLLLEEG